MTTKLRLEGMNELCVRLLSMVAAALAGLLLSGGGWDAVQLVALASQLVTLVFVVWFAFASNTWCCQRYQCPTPTSSATGVMPSGVLIDLADTTAENLAKASAHPPPVADP